MIDLSKAVMYELVQVSHDRKPVVGEIRYIIPLVPMAGEPLASMMPTSPIAIIWDRTQWVIP